MNSSSRLGDALAFECEREESLVALVGFRHRLGSSAIGLFERCQLRVLDLATPAAAIRTFETIAPDAVVVDSRHDALKLPGGSALDLLRALSAQHPELDRQTPLVLLNSTGVSRALRSAFLDAGAVLIPAHLQTHRHLIRLLRRLCGFVEGCCAVGDLPKSVFNADATDSLHRRH